MNTCRRSKWSWCTGEGGRVCCVREREEGGGCAWECNVCLLHVQVYMYLQFIFYSTPSVVLNAKFRNRLSHYPTFSPCTIYTQTHNFLHPLSLPLSPVISPFPPSHLPLPFFPPSHLLFPLFPISSAPPYLHLPFSSLISSPLPPPPSLPGTSSSSFVPPWRR